MKSRSGRERCERFGCSVVALWMIAGAAQAAEPVSGADLEEVVVTASRRDASIKEIPTAISAYGGDRLAKAHVQTLADLVTSAPNVQLGAYGVNTNVAIRGIGNGFTTAGSDPGVAFHLDGVYLADTGLTVSTLLDVNRIEILRGPQGTLFGRNATGGAVNIIPNAPSADLSYGVDLSAGVSPTQDHVAAYLSGPLAGEGRVRGRLSIQQTFNDGFTQNLAAGGPDRLDDRDNYAVRGQLMWLPTDDFSARVSLEHQREDSRGPALFNVGRPDMTVPLPAQIAGRPVGNLKARTTYANQAAQELESQSAGLFTDWAVAGGSLKGTFSVGRSEQFTNTDGDGTAVDFTNTEYRQRARQQFAELIYASDPTAAFTYVLGVNYFRERRAQNITVPIAFLPLPGVALGGRLRTASYAAFGHGQYAFDGGVKLFAGARITRDEKRIAETNNFVGALSQKADWVRATYEVGGSYDLNARVTGYVKYATGYKGGGFSSGSLAPAFNPETDKTLEAGLKGSYFDGALQANIAAFHTRYSNLQVSQTIGVLSAVTNAARATVDGVEIEAVARMGPRLRIEFSGGLLDARFDEFLTADSARPALGVLDLSGNRLPQSPKATASIAGYYEVPLERLGQLTLGAQYEWKSRVYFSEFNLPVAAQDAVGKLNLTANWASPDARWSAGLFARNLTDRTVIHNVLVVSALLGSVGLAQVQPGREIGLSLHYRY